MQARRATLKDVAKGASVSLKTASRVINRESGVAEGTRQRVLKIAEELGYRADLQARALRRGDRSTQSVGLLVSSVANPFAAQIHAAIATEAEEHDAVVLALSSEDDPAAERDRVGVLFHRHVDGLVVAASGEDQSWLSEISQATPVVFVDREPHPLLGDTVISTNELGARQAVQHLLDQGHRRIALLTDDQRIQTARARRAGYHQALEAAGNALVDGMEYLNLKGEDAARQAVQELIAGEQITAIFAAQNHLAAGAIRALYQAGLSAEIALVSFDDLPFAELLPMPLTAMVQDATRLGELAAQRLFARISGLDEAPQVFEVPTELIIRGSGEIPPRTR